MKPPFELEEDIEIVTIKGLTHGLYEIYWKGSGSSLAAVGYDSAGNNWHAACNWLDAPSKDWSLIKAYKLLIPNDYLKNTKGIKSDYQKVFI